MPTVTLTRSCLALRPQHPAPSWHPNDVHRMVEMRSRFTPKCEDSRGKATSRAGVGQDRHQPAHTTSACMALPVKEQVRSIKPGRGSCAPKASQQTAAPTSSSLLSPGWMSSLWGFWGLNPTSGQGQPIPVISRVLEGSAEPGEAGEECWQTARSRPPAKDNCSGVSPFRRD